MSAALAGGLVVSVLAGGCAHLRYVNTAPYVERHVRATDEPLRVLVFKTAVLYPARDLLTLDWLWRLLFGDEAWNANGGGVADGSFFTNRPATQLTPAAVARGPCDGPPPQPPISIKRVKKHGRSPGFIGTDALGRTFLFKPDHPDYPELGSSAAVIGSRILWAVGYNVPPVYVTEIQGTGDERFDGRRAAACLFLDHVAGHFNFDWFRYRREVRALRLACAWINDTDRIGPNTLVTMDHGRARYVLIDFNSCLGSWNGRPKKPWRGHRHAGDLFGALALGLAGHDGDSRHPVVSPAVGRFDGLPDPMRWRSQHPNTAFERMSEADARWIGRKIAALGRQHLEAIVAEAQLTNPADAEYLVKVLMERRARILEVAGVPDTADSPPTPPPAGPSQP